MNIRYIIHLTSLDGLSVEIDDTENIRFGITNNKESYAEFYANPLKDLSGNRYYKFQAKDLRYRDKETVDYMLFYYEVSEDQYHNEIGEKHDEEMY